MPPSTVDDAAEGPSSDQHFLPVIPADDNDGVFAREPSTSEILVIGSSLVNHDDPPAPPTPLIRLLLAILYRGLGLLVVLMDTFPKRPSRRRAQEEGTSAG